MTQPRQTRLRQLAADAPLVQDAGFRPDKNDRAYQDDQARAAQAHLLQSLLLGVHATWATIDSGSAALKVGDVTCLAGSPLGTITLATATPLSAAGSIFGVAIMAGSPGSRIPVALLGLLPPAITGLPSSGNNLFARVKTSTGRIETVASLTTADFPVGTVDAAGNCSLRAPIPPATLSGTGYLNIAVNGTLLTNRNKVDFLGPTVSGADNSGAAKTDVTIAPGVLSFTNIAAMSAFTVTSLSTGQVAYVVTIGAYFALDKASVLTPDAIAIVTATTGNWIRS